MTSFLKKLLTLLLLSSPLYCFAGETNIEDKKKIQVLISIAPYTEIVQKIGKEHVEVKLVVPQGADSHNYEPTIKQIQQASKSAVWFTIGEAFEKKMQQALCKENKNLIISDLKQGLHLHHETCKHHQGGFDPHIWMSPHMMMHQAETIASELQKVLPEHKEEIANNLAETLTTLHALDDEMHALFQDKTPLTVLVAHPSYGYFCTDYGITQLAIEHEGKDPTAKQLTALLKDLKNLPIKKVFVQNQYSHKGAELIAKQIGAEVVVLNPFSDHYVEMIREIGHQFATSVRTP